MARTKKITYFVGRQSATHGIC